MVGFDRSVFVNCPFDDAYAPTLQAICFCLIFLGFEPRLAPENADNAAARLDRIAELIRNSRFGIHDLSRCKADEAGDYARMNMPFELGLDHACRRYGPGQLAAKAILVLEHTRYDYQRTLSDISGWDIHAHNGSFEQAMKKVRDWLVAQAQAERVPPSIIETKYATFQGWHVERELAGGASQKDILEFPTSEVITAMHEWMAADQPDSFEP